MSNTSKPESEAERERLLTQFQTTAVRGRNRSEQDTAEAAGALAADGETYAAFKPLDKRQLSLHIRPAFEFWQWVKYGYMQQITADSDGTRLDIICHFLTVTVTGHNLLEIGDAIANERCDMIQQFDARKWPRPRDPSKAFIENIVYAVLEEKEEAA